MFWVLDCLIPPFPDLAWFDCFELIFNWLAWFELAWVAISISCIRFYYYVWLMVEFGWFIILVGWAGFGYSLMVWWLDALRSSYLVWFGLNGLVDMISTWLILLRCHGYSKVRPIMVPLHRWLDMVDMVSLFAMAWITVWYR